MEHQKRINLLDNKPNQASKFRTKNWVEINDYSHRVHNTDSQIRCKNSMRRWSLYDYSDAYILVRGRTIITRGLENATAADKVGKRDKEVRFKNYAPFIECTSEVNNTQTDHAKDLDIAMSNA